MFGQRSWILHIVMYYLSVLQTTTTIEIKKENLIFIFISILNKAID